MQSDYKPLILLKQFVKLHYIVTFQMLHCVVTLDKKWENWPTLIISYKVISGSNICLTRYYENLDFQKKRFFNIFKNTW